MVLVIPMEEQGIESGEEKMKATEPEPQNLGTEDGNEVQQTGANKIPHTGNAAEANPSSAREANEKPN
jgi:hypothetical protein